jgi:autotransporter-associated beta strand protein
MSGRLACFVRYAGLCTLVATGALWIAQSAKADSFDWRTVNGQNWNSTVKSQFGGTCWDFSACGTLEAKYKLTRNDASFNADVSEQQVCWETDPDMGSTGGGWGPSVLNYFTSHGVVSETECPYNSTSPDVGVSPKWPLTSGWQNRAWKSTANLNDFTNDTNTMKAYLKSSGPLEVGIWAGHDLYTSVSDMVANYRAPDASGFDHEISLVGYYDDASIPTGGYWVIKNSWGYSNTNLTDYGNNGYYLIPYGNIEVHNDVSAITGGVYYTGAMATATWTGTTNSTWDTTYGNRRNWSKSGANYQWANQETQANFTSSATRRTITISGSAIAHGLNFSATGYSISSGSLTVTGGGIVASESVTINSPVYIGAPQSWNVSAGKTLSITGPLHTVISDLTFSGAGDTTISSTIDGGGVINLVGGAKPGGLIQAGAGTVTLSGESHFLGDITAQAGSGALNILPPGADSATFDGAFLGGGTINIACSGVVTLNGTSNYSGILNMQQPGTLKFMPAAGAISVFSGAINTPGPIIQDGPGTTILSGNCSYANGLTIVSGTLGLRDVTDPALLAGNFSVGSGRLEFNTVTANTEYTGVISGSGGLNKSGARKLTISGATGNLYSGDTNILGGSVDMNKTSGYAVPGNLNFSPQAGAIFVRLLGNNQVAPSAALSFNGSSAQILELMGHALTVAGLSDSPGLAFIENTDAETGDYATAVLTFDGAANSVFNGCLRDNNGTGTSKLALVKNGAGTLTLARNRCGMYTGGLTVNAGTLDYSGGVLPNCDYTITGGTLNTGHLSQLIGAFKITGGAVSGTGTLISNAAFDLENGTVDIGLGGNAGLIKSGPGIVSLTKSLPGGNYTIADGTLNLNALSQAIDSFHITGGVVSGTGTLTSNAAYDLQNGTVDIGLGGNAGLIKSGPGTVSLTKNLPGGNYTISDGTLNLNALSQSIGSFQITGGTVNGSGTLTSNAAYDVQAGTVNLILAGAVGLNKTGTGTAILTANNTYTGPTTITAGALQLGNGTSTGSVAGNIAIDAAGALIVNNPGNLTYSGKLSGTGTLIKSGSNTLTLSGNAFSGNLVVNSGTLGFTGASTLPVGDYTVTGGTLSLGSFSQSIGTLQITGGTVSGAGTLTGDAVYDVQAGAVNAILGGSVGLNKTTPGIATLGGNNTYTGPTLISAGELVLSATGQISASSPITNEAMLSFEGNVLHTVGVIDGFGATQVLGDTTLMATSITQTILSIGFELPPPVIPPTAAASGSAAASVPEPATLSLLGCFGLAFAAYFWRKRTRKTR